MLLSLYIENFGLADSLELKTGPGLNALTGETGAGKSILVEALVTALGGRCSADMIRTGRDRALVQATFDTGSSGTLVARLAEYGLEPGEDGLVIMSRELHRQGRNICRFNGRIVNLSVFRDLAGLLVEMHGQHEQQSLLRPDRQLRLLDRYGGQELAALVEKTGAAYRAWRETVARREEILAGSRERQQRMDMLEYQVAEINSSGLEDEDEAELYRKRDRLVNAERIGGLSEAVLQKIHRGNDHCPAAVDLLGASRQELEELCRYLPEGKSCLENLEAALCLVEDTARELAAYRESLETGPEELNYVEERLALLEKLKRKYADTLAGIMAYRDRAAEELEQLRGLESGIDGLDESVRKCEQAYQRLAAETGRLRAAAARRLEEEVRRELRALEMPRVEFAVRLNPAQPSETGTESVQFMFSSNPGEPLQPLSRTASGGELSRVMLAVRSILAAADDTATLVFDEIDAGIGGRTIRTVAEKLAQLGEQRQIICITHAAAVAALASTHYLVSKKETGQRTVTTVERLEGDARIRELNRMLGGDEDSELLARYARRMLG